MNITALPNQLESTMADAHLDAATTIIEHARSGSGQAPVVHSFFDEPTNTVS